MSDWFDEIRPRLLAAPREQQRAAAVAAARAALARLPLDEPAVAAAAAGMEAGGWGDSAERAQLAAACDALEERSLAAEAAHAREEIGTAEMMAAFIRARVAMSLLAALDADPRTAALEAVYQSWTALQDEPGPLVEAVTVALAGGDGAGVHELTAAAAAPEQWLEPVAVAVRTVDPEIQRRAAVAAAEALLERHPSKARPVRRAAEALRHGNYGDSRTRRALLDHASKLSREADALRERGEPEDAVLAVQARASTAFALWNALDANPLSAALKALLSAWNVLQDDSAITRRLAELGLVRLR